MNRSKNFVNILNYANKNLLQTNQFRCQVTQAVHDEQPPVTKNETKEIDWNNALPYTKIPGPSKFELIKNFIPGGKLYKISRQKLAETLRNDYGDIFRVPATLGRKEFLLVFQPEYFKKIFRNDGPWPNRRGLETLTHYRHNMKPEIFTKTGTLLTSNDEEWAKLRSKINPVMMQPKTVKIYIPRMDKTAQKFIKRIREIRNPNTLEISQNFEKEINAWALEQICLVGLDTELGLIGNIDNNKDARKLINAIGTIFSTVDKVEFQPSMWRYYETSDYKKLIKAYDVLTDISLQYINEALQRYNMNKDNDNRSEDEKSIVERLLKIDKDVAVVAAMEMFFAGVDTTTTVLAGVLLSLAKNPEKQKILREEIMTILPTPETHITEESLKKVSYLRAVIKESIRLYPVVHEILRTTQVDLVLDKYQIPKGTDILLHGTHFYKNNEYFQKPNEFIPERWLRRQNSNDASKSGCPAENLKVTHPFVYFPFGSGSRMCVGKRLVEMELEIILARIVRNFNIEYNYDVDDFFDLKLIYTPAKEMNFKLTDIGK